MYDKASLPSILETIKGSYKERFGELPDPDMVATFLATRYYEEMSSFLKKSLEFLKTEDIPDVIKMVLESKHGEPVKEEGASRVRRRGADTSVSKVRPGSSSGT